MTEIISIDDKLTEPNEDIVVEFPDIIAYDNALDNIRNVFIERKNLYNNHLDRNERYPLYLQSALYLKASRAIDDIRQGEDIKKDTLIDLANYAIMMLSIPK